MKQINIILVLLYSVFLTFCSVSSDNNGEEDNGLRKYHINEELLATGYVKIYNLKTNQEEKVVYNLQQKTTKNEFVSTYYDQDFVKTKEVYYRIMENCFEEKKHLLYKNNTPYSLKIVNPMIFPFYVTEQEFKSEYVYPDNRMFSVKSEYSFKFLEKSIIKYKKDSIECIVYQSDGKKTEFNKETKKKREKYSYSKMYFGEGLGYIYQEIITGSDTISYTLQDIIGIEEFEQMK